jgi:hypothetical protein
MLVPLAPSEEGKVLIFFSSYRLSITAVTPMIVNDDVLTNSKRVSEVSRMTAEGRTSRDDLSPVYFCG